jgi:polyketide synthase-associated protein
MAFVKFDVAVSDYPNPDDLAYLVVQALQAKGFCVIDTGADVDQCAEAIEEIRELQAMFPFHPPPAEILDGLLGQEGSASLFEFDPEEHSRAYNNLTRFDNLATSMGRLLENEIEAIGIEVANRTSCLVHETGTWDKKQASALTEKTAEDWLNTFVYHKLMALQFLGPGEDMTLEMEYLALCAEKPATGGDEEEVEDADDLETNYIAVAETEKFRMQVAPGTMVLLRPDILGHTLTGTEGNLALSAFFLPTSRKGPTRGGTLPELTPCARRLDAWSMQRLMDLANAPISLDPDNPLEMWRVTGVAAFIMDAPREINKGGDRLEIAKKGDLLHGSVEVVGGLQWLKVPSTVTDEFGRPRSGYVLIDGDKVGAGKIVEKVEDMSIDWLIARDHQYVNSAAPPVCIRSMAIKSATSHNSDEFWAPSPSCPDFAIEVPYQRWDHNQTPWTFYDVNHVKHGCFTEGIELFDNKLFAVSNAEVVSMDPHQRLALECADEAFKRCGLEKKDLMRSVSGVYIGGGSIEWGVVPKTYDSSADMYGCTGGSGAIQANRISFNLGLMGPSLVFIADECSSLLAVERGHMSFDPKKVMNIRCVSMGTCLNMAQMSWVRAAAIGVMCSEGVHRRTRSFEENGYGFIKGDCACAVHLSALTDTVDGVKVRDESKVEEGLMTACCALHHDQNEGLGHPHAPTEQALIAMTCRMAGVCPASIDMVDCHAEGRILVDACEAYSLDRALRRNLPEGGEDVPLFLTSYYSCQGICHEAANVNTLVRLLKSAQYGAMGPICHLRVLNPHLEPENSALQFATETVPFRMRQSILGMKGMSLGGTQAMATFACTSEEEHVQPSKPIQNPATKIAFWPGGGGSLEDAARARRGYEIIGSWDGWSQTMEMTQESQSGEMTTYSAIITLGPNRFEMFQILLDGDRKKVLHPGQPKAPQNIPVFGPDSNVPQYTWLIDGHSYGGYYADPEGAAIVDEPGFQPLALGDLTFREPNVASAAQQAESVHIGRPGDQYCVRLSVAGKWRTVNWSKVETKTGDNELATFLDDNSSYYVVADWNGWSFDQPMTKDDSAPGTFVSEVKLLVPPGEFQIVRNNDWDQAFCAETERSKTGGLAYGPMEYVHGQSWALDGKPGDVFRIEFQRRIEGDEDASMVSFRCLRTEEVGPEETLPPLYYLIGTMDTGRLGKLKMRYIEDDACCVCTFEIGSLGQESFQILVNGDWNAVVAPDRPDANPHEAHAIRGPMAFGYGLSWTIGAHEEDAEAAGESYEVKLHLRGGRRTQWPHKVEWRRI